MSWSRIKGVISQDIHISRREPTMWFELFVFGAMGVIVFGFLARYLAGDRSASTGSYVIAGMMFWELTRITQSSVTINSLWNIWSGNLSNVFIAPISLAEYIVGNCLVSLVKCVPVFCMLALVGVTLFDFNAFALGAVDLALILLNLVLFAWSMGFALIGLIFRYGRRVQSIAWGAIYFVQPLTAVFYPVSVLPEWLQQITWSFPSTYVLEAARHLIDGEESRWDLYLGATLLNAVWIIAALCLFSHLFTRSRIVGQFARNDH